MPLFASSFAEEIRRLQTEFEITTLFVTHDQEEALAISDRVGVMANGRLAPGHTGDGLRAAGDAIRREFVGVTNAFSGTAAAGGAVFAGGLRVPAAVVNGPRAPGAGPGPPDGVRSRPVTGATDRHGAGPASWARSPGITVRLAAPPTWSGPTCRRTAQPTIRPPPRSAWTSTSRRHARGPVDLDRRGEVHT
jgi:putative spermidine/putrescine transport system ATP-binding protein